MPRLTKLYTRKGDDGESSLGGGQRIGKESLRMEAYGTVDELNSVLGVANAMGVSEALSAELLTIQNTLFHLGSDLCFLEEDKTRYNLPQIRPDHITNLEQLIDRLSEQVGPLENFILPGGSLPASQLHVARTVCRRAERIVIALSRTEKVGEWVIPYLNRLSDALFIMARYENYVRQQAEPLWDSRV